jgi:DnaJ-class molecular chaperone
LSEITPLEIHALAKIIDELSYYQLLHLEASASTTDIRKAYHATSRTYHPDTNRHLDSSIRADCGVISKRVTEAYCVLRDPRRRRVYDSRMSDGGDKRMQLAEATAEHARKDSAERRGATPQGRQFFQKAEQDIGRQNWQGAIQNLQMALTFERGNPLFTEKLAEVKEKAKAS